MSGHPMRGVEGAGAYRTGHPLGLDNVVPKKAFQKIFTNFDAEFRAHKPLE
jgi:hypothetical protein